jgi:hypothetical protein
MKNALKHAFLLAVAVPLASYERGTVRLAVALYRRGYKWRFLHAALPVALARRTSWALEYLRGTGASSTP